jgi:SAM-dependent methyltransferase
VLERTFGEAYADFTEQTLREVTSRVAPPARIVDFGAGTGRLALPLALDGYRVTAVDPSTGMLDRLADKERAMGRGDVGADRAEAKIRRVVTGVERYRGSADHDFALCVFSVLGYLLDEDALVSAADGMASALRPGGLLLVDVPGRAVFEGFDVEADDVLRCVEVEPLDGAPDVYHYQESGAVRGHRGEERYSDAFRVRYWPRSVVLEALVGAGFRWVEDRSEAFEAWGADYLLLERG